MEDPKPVLLKIEELEERIAPSVTSASPTGKHRPEMQDFCRESPRRLSEINYKFDQCGEIKQCSQKKLIKGNTTFAPSDEMPGRRAACPQLFCQAEILSFWTIATLVSGQSCFLVYPT
jgi:hypothetical protein